MTVNLTGIRPLDTIVGISFMIFICLADRLDSIHPWQKYLIQREYAFPVKFWGINLNLSRIGRITLCIYGSVLQNRLSCKSFSICKHRFIIFHTRYFERFLKNRINPVSDIQM